MTQSESFYEVINIQFMYVVLGYEFYRSHAHKRLAPQAHPCQLHIIFIGQGGLERSTEDVNRNTWHLFNWPGRYNTISYNKLDIIHHLEGG